MVSSATCIAPIANVLESGSVMEPTVRAASDAGGKVRIRSPRFLAFLTAQFLGALNDNALKITLVLFLLSVVSGETQQVRYSGLATALFPIPFLMFSPLAGYLADRYGKDRVLLWTKCPEILVMSLATVGFALRSIPMLFAVLFMSATHSAFFSPAKYGILPEVFDDADISVANGVLELTTDLAILIGSIVGVVLYSRFQSELAHAGAVLLVIACAGTLAILFVPRTPPGNREARFAWNVVSSFSDDLAEIRRSSTLFYTVVGITWFGFLGAFFLTVVPVFGTSELALTEERTGLLLAMLSIGVGLGAFGAGRLSNKHVEIGLVPLGSVGVTLFSLLLARSGPVRALPWLHIPYNTAADLLMLGFSAGFFIIPLNALLQQRAPKGMKGRLIAFANVLSFGAVLAAAGVPWLLTDVLGLTIRQSILFVGLVTLAGTIYVVRMLPDFLVRLVIWLFTNTIYRIRTAGEENIPATGALLVANHVSWVDALLVAASSGRMVRFLMFRPYYEWRPLNWFFRMMHVIPVAANDPPEKIAESLALARREIEHGHTVCIFAEGSITRTGNLLKFKRGLERIASNVNCPIVPVYLDGVWGSIFSFDRGRFFFKMPKRLLEPVTIYFGRPMQSSATAVEVRQAIQELSVEAFRNRIGSQRPLHVAFLRRAKRRWFGTLAADANGSSVSFGQALVRSIALSRMIWKSSPASDERVGIMISSGIDALLAHFAVWFAGRVPVDINPAESDTAIGHIVSSANLHTVITSRRQTMSTQMLSPAEVVYFEDLRNDIAWWRSAGLSVLWFLTPSPLLAAIFLRGNSRDCDRVATIFYSSSSGSEAQPRGALLTHHNLLSNLESLRQIFRVTRRDCILGIMPFSSAMSFAGTLLLPALTGARVAYGEELVKSDALGPFCRTHRVTLIPSSPQVLSEVMVHVSSDDLRNLRYVAVGGDSLSDALRDGFTEKFGIEPLEGYGRPECAPIVSLNIPDFSRGTNRQPGTRAGTAGHPLPGISLKIVDPVTGIQVPHGTEGVLLVRGPNVMKGYVDSRDEADVALLNGWFRTDDRASIDSEGFLKLAARPSTR